MGNHIWTWSSDKFKYKVENQACFASTLNYWNRCARPDSLRFYFLGKDEGVTPEFQLSFIRPMKTWSFFGKVTEDQTAEQIVENGFVEINFPNNKPLEIFGTLTAFRYLLEFRDDVIVKFLKLQKKSPDNSWANFIEAHNQGYINWNHTLFIPEVLKPVKLSKRVEEIKQPLLKDADFSTWATHSQYDKHTGLHSHFHPEEYRG